MFSSSSDASKKKTKGASSLFSKAKANILETKTSFLNMFDSMKKAPDHETDAMELVKKMENMVLQQSRLLSEQQRYAQYYQQQQLLQQQQMYQGQDLEYLAKHAQHTTLSSYSTPSNSLSTSPEMSSRGSSLLMDSQPQPQISVKALLERFFAKYDPSVIASGKIDQILIWTAQYGIAQLNTMLVQKYGDDLYLSASNKAVAQTAVPPPNSLPPASAPASIPVNSQIDKLARQIQGYFKAHDKTKDNREEALKIAQHFSVVGIWELNKQFEADYGESLEDFVTRMDTYFRGALTTFYQKHDPSRLGNGFDAIVIWSINNGEKAVNERLFEKYGEGLTPVDKKVAELVRSRADSKTSAIEIARSRAGSIMKEAKSTNKASNSEEEKKRAILLALLQVFFETHDPKEIEDPKNLNQWVDWALKHSDEALDKVLAERYGEDLTTTGLRWDPNEAHGDISGKQAEGAIDV